MDPTVAAVPFYFASMQAERRVLRRRASEAGPSAGDYERRDTFTSLGMGLISLAAPLVAPRVLRPFTPGRGRFGRSVVLAAAGAAVVTTLADRAERRARGEQAGDRAARARKVAAVGGVTTTVLGAVAVATTWQSRTSLQRMWNVRKLRPLGQGPATMAAAIAGWDFIYYWNHRFMHECRWMWAIHVVHHSSERYNLSTALRQPVLDAVGTPIPYSLLCLVGIQPSMISTARGVNLLYQYWIHTETIGRIAAAEGVVNSPSHHRVHHGSNRAYIDRNHGSILIIWDRLFGTFEPEKEKVVYGLTKNIGTFNLGTAATHEFRAILADVASSTSWRERLSFVGRSPGWADRHRAGREGRA